MAPSLRSLNDMNSPTGEIYIVQFEVTLFKKGYVFNNFNEVSDAMLSKDFDEDEDLANWEKDILPTGFLVGHSDSPVELLKDLYHIDVRGYLGMGHGDWASAIECDVELTSIHNIFGDYFDLIVKYAQPFIDIAKSKDQKENYFPVHVPIVFKYWWDFCSWTGEYDSDLEILGLLDIDRVPYFVDKDKEVEVCH